MAKIIQLPSGVKASVEFGFWTCPEPSWQDELNSQTLAQLRALTGQQLAYFPDDDGALAMLAAQHYGGTVIQNTPADIPPGVVP